MTVEVIIAETENIHPHLVIENDVPQEIYFISVDEPKKKILELKLDAIDEMVLGNFDALRGMEKPVREELLNCVKKVLYMHLGGKCLFNIPQEFQEEIEKILKLKTIPTYPDDKYSFFGRLMAAESGNTKLQAKFESYKDKFAVLDKNYHFITKQSQDYADKASRLMIDYADWAGKDQEARRTYGREGMKCRFKNNIVKTYLAVNRDDEQVDGIVRVCNQGDIYYVSDLTIREEKRGQGLAMKLLQQALRKIPPTGRIVLIAGNEKLIELYKKLGFEKIVEKHPISFNNNNSENNNNVLVCGLIPKQYLINKLHKSFEIPQSPKPVRFSLTEKKPQITKQEEEIESIPAYHH